METTEDREKSFFEGLKEIEKHFENKLQYPITAYFEYKKHPGIPVCFKGEMGLEEDIKNAITNLQARTISF